jgi:hypothetical protein
VLADRARQEDAVAGADCVRRNAGARVALADTGGADVHAVGRSALDHLGVAAHDLDLRRLRRAGDGLHLRAQVLRGQTLLQDQGEGERLRARSRDRQVVDGSVHRKVPDGATRKAERLDHEGVGRERERGARDLERGGVLRDLGAERGLEQALDHALGGLAARAVSHVDALVAELPALRAGGLDDPQDALLAVGHLHQTTSRSRAKRPKL